VNPLGMLPQPLRLKISNELSFARGERGGYVVVSGSNYVHTCRDSGAQSTKYIFGRLPCVSSTISNSCDFAILRLGH